MINKEKFIKQVKRKESRMKGKVHHTYSPGEKYLPRPPPSRSGTISHDFGLIIWMHVRHGGP